MDPKTNPLEEGFTRQTFSKNDLCIFHTRLIIFSQKFPDTYYI